ncbi:phage tail protein [Bifidobacterium hominis]|uniref:phage tail protein n=1 Tax=Bifidobacterium hominis TaxID=3133177 RepID=UPI003D041E6E
MRFALFDRFGKPLGDIATVLEAIRTRATDGTDTLDITVIGEIGKDERIVFKDSMGRWAEYICQYPETERSTGRPVTTAYCSGSVSELSRTYIEDRRNRDATSVACAAKALDGTKWKTGTIQAGTSTHTADLSFYHTSAIDALDRVCDTFGLELSARIEVSGDRVSARYVDLLEHRGQSVATRRFEYGHDLTSVKRTVDGDDVVTRLWCWGKGVEAAGEDGNATGGYGRKIGISDVNGGKPYIDADASTLAQWGIIGADGKIHPAEGSYEDGDIDDPAKLLAAGKAYLAKASKPSVSYTADVETLGKAGFDAAGVDVGDDVQIVDTTFTPALRLEGRVLKIEEDLIGGPDATKITLGNIRQTITQRMGSQQQQLDKLINSSGAWNDAAGGKGVYIADLIDRINQVMNETGGYVYQTPNQGIYVYDKPIDQHPTQVIQIGGGYWRCASSKKANGDWNWRSLANGKGIFADAIYTGLLSDAARRNYWNLDTGEFSLSANTTIAGNNAGDLATNQTARQLTSEAEAAAKEYANSVGSDTLASAKADATAKANTAETNAKKAASVDAQSKADAALASAKKAAAAGDTSTLEAAKSYADNTATSHVDTFQKALTQQYIFNKLTNNGQLQGLYMSGGLLYVNATYLRSGIISGARSYWNLDSGIFSMADANGTETVHLDGNSGRNTLTGTFQTGTSGSRLWMSPNFKQTPIGGTADIAGAGISFIHATDAAQHPYIASESTNSEVGEISTLTFNGGRRANNDPGAFMRVGSTKTDNAKKKSLFQAMALRDYSVSSNDAKSSGARLAAVASPDSTVDTYAEIASWDANGAVGVKADINNGYLYMGGFLGGYTNRHTFIGAAAWKAWTPNGGPISSGASIAVHYTLGSPAKYGRYYAVANADGEWGGIIMHVKNTGGQSGWDIQMYNADRNACSVDMWCGTFGWLVK